MEIRPYHTGDELAIENLFKDAFGKPMPFGFWEWRYKNNPFLTDLLIHLMWDGDTLAGHYAASPVEMKMGDATIHMTALSMTTMTNPLYAGRGIFKSLAESLYEEAERKHNIRLIWGFPNSNSHYGFIKNLNWKDVGIIPFLSLPVKNLSDFNFSDYQVAPCFTASHAETLNQSKHHVKINKTLKYLNWRYIENPVYKYHIIELAKDPSKNFIVFKVFRSFSDSTKFEADIVECSYLDQEAVYSLIRSLVSYSVKIDSPVSKVNTWESIFSNRHIQLEKIGFALSGPLTYLGIRQSGELGHLDVSDLKNWEIGMGYSDVF